MTTVSVFQNTKPFEQLDVQWSPSACGSICEEGGLLHGHQAHKDEGSQ